MRVTFVAIGGEFLSIGYLAAMLKKNGHDVELAFAYSLFSKDSNPFLTPLSSIFNDEKKLLNSIKNHRSQLVAFSVVSSQYQRMLSLAKQIKEDNPDTKIIFGGPHPSAVPDRVISMTEVDFVCVGEGEYAILRLLRALEDKSLSLQNPIANIYFKTKNNQIVRGEIDGFIKILDALPFADKDIWKDYLSVGEFYNIMASRGCPHRCAFCFNSFFSKLPTKDKSNYLRRRSVEHVITELSMAKKQYALKRVMFLDDLFTTHKGWLKEFLQQYKRKINLSFKCLTHPLFIDQDKVNWLYEAGCTWIEMGVQTVDGICKKNIDRVEDVSHIEYAMNILSSSKIKLQIDHILGFPKESLSAQEYAQKIYCKYTPDRIAAHWFRFYPGTQILEDAKLSGFLNQQQIDNINNGGFTKSFNENSFDFIDIKRVKIFLAYRSFYMLLPLIPSFLNKIINYKLFIKLFIKLPKKINAFLAFLFDGLTGIIKNNPDHITFLKSYYIFIGKVCKRRILKRSY